jgi:hypothetical protein
VTNITWPTPLGGGYYTGGSLGATLDVVVKLTDGGLTAVTGQFEATGCDYYPLAN